MRVFIRSNEDAPLRSSARAKDHRGCDLISDALPFGRLSYGEPNVISNAIGYAQHYSRSHDAVIRVYDAAGNVIDDIDGAARLLIHWNCFALLCRTREGGRNEYRTPISFSTVK
jgi:hypothetical protein